MRTITVRNSRHAEPAITKNPDLPAQDLGSVVAARLRRSGHPFLWGVVCTYSEGVVVLSGAVPTFYLKQLAQELASRTPLVTEVRNCLLVNTAAIQSSIAGSPRLRS
jgi:hypothetical protein